MIFTFKFIFSSSINNLVCSTSNASSFKRLLATSLRCKRHYCDSATKKKNHVPFALSDKYEIFSDENAPVILDVEEERQKISFEEKVNDEFEGLNLQRGVTGVFDIEEIVNILKKEKAEDVFVVKIPQEYNYADYMVIVNGRSSRHMLAMADFIRKIYKRKVVGNQYIPKLEGKKSNLWMALDLGNIILHVFSKAGRELYDLDTLWSVGREYDSISNNKSLQDVSITYTEVLASLYPKN